MIKYVAEFIGTAMLIILGDGVCANCFLTKSGMKGGNTVHITLGWGLAVLLPVFIFGSTSGAHINPAVTIGLAVAGKFPWAEVPGYVIAQLLGGFVGAIILWLMWGDQFNATEDAGAIKGSFCTGPSIRNYPRNFFSEFMGAGILLFSLSGLSTVVEPNAVGVNYFLIFGIFVALGMSFGGLTGYATNPARDLGPRLAHAILPIKHKGSSDWSYAWIPVFGPICGGICFALLYNLVATIK